MKSTREKVLQRLATNPKATIIDIANAVGINAISVRHHLTSLQVDGLVSAEEERHGVGRPRLIYSLTESGMEKFPTRYFRLTNHLLNQIKESLSEPGVRELFNGMAQNLAAEYQPLLKNLDFVEKLDVLKKVMSNEGFNLEWKKITNGYEIQEVTCPFLQIGKDHPEICIFDTKLIANLLDIPERCINRVTKANHSCIFEISTVEN